MVQKVVHAMDVVQHLNEIRHLQRLEGLPNLSLSEDSFHLLAGQSAACHTGGGIGQVNDHIIVQSVKILLFLLILQLSGEFRQLRLRCIRRIRPRHTDCILRNQPDTLSAHRTGDSVLSAQSSDQNLRNAPFFCNFSGSYIRHSFVLSVLIGCNTGRYTPGTRYTFIVN